MNRRSPAIDTAVLVAGAAAMGVSLSATQIAAFEAYAAALVDWNARFNLTRVVDPAGIARRHVLDSLAVLAALPADESPGRPLRCVDVGAGAGLPGVALKIVRPMWHLALVESVAKKAGFLAYVLATLDLGDAVVLAARAEEVGRDPAHRASYDLAVARAVADLAVLVEYVLPLLAVGGRLVAHKGADAPTEASRARRAIDVLGGRLVECGPYALPGEADTRHLVVVDKIGPTPDGFPRRAGIAAKRPLR